MTAWLGMGLALGGWMSGKFLTRAMFVVSIATITAVTVIPHADDGFMVASNVTPSGMED